MHKKGTLFQSLVAATAFLVPLGCGPRTREAPAAEQNVASPVWSVTEGGKTFPLTSLPETPQQLVKRLEGEGYNVLFSPEFQHGETAMLEQIGRLTPLGTGMVYEWPDTPRFKGAVSRYQEGDKAPLTAILNHPRDAYAPSNAEARTRYFSAKLGMITGPLDRNIPVEAMDKATFPEAIAATRAGNEHIAFKCATNLYLNINTPSATAQTIQKNDRLTNWAEQFAFGNLLSEDEGKKMTAALGLEDLDSLQKISDAIRTMPEEKFPAFKAVLVSHLGRVTGEAATIEGTDTAKAKELLERKLVEFSDRKHAAEEKRDVIREAYMSDRIVAVFQGQMDAGKKPLLMVVCGAGHTEHHAEGKEGRDDLDELVMQKDKRIKAAVITFVPLKKEELEKLPLKDGTAVFYAGGGYQGAQYVCFIEGARYNAICRLSEAPGKAPNHAELEKVRQFQERQPKETQR